MTADVVATTAQGRLRGERDGGALRFLGVPYAESPATAGRFAAPVPHARWDGIRDALAYGATSPQPDRGITLIPEPVIAGDNELNLNVFTPELSGGISLPWAPYADGEVVTDDPLTAAASPRNRKVALLAGATAHEFNMAWLAADWITAAIAADGLDQAGVPAAAVDAYVDQAGPLPSRAVGQAVTDRVFRVPAQQLAAAKASAGGSAFTYDFRWTAAAGPLPGLAFHCLDVPFFFDALAEPGVTEAMGPEPPQDLATRAHGTLVRFVTDGDPGWEPFGNRRSPVMIFAGPSEIRENPLELERTAWA